MLVLAGPGSGKTHVITKRIENLIQEYKVRPEEILVITFTKYAANEMKMRFRKNNPNNSLVTFGTFHGIFYGILKWAYGIGSQNILSEEEKYKLITDILGSTEIDESISIDMEEEKDFISNIGKEISLVKSHGLNIDDYECKECPNHVFHNIFLQYETKRKKYKKIDFDDMILQCYRLFCANREVLEKWQGKFKYILIDEFQDINQMQFDTIKLLAQPENNIFVVGDDDQSIYRFRGAKPEIMLGFQRVYPTTKKVILETNYRSTKSIVAAATKVIQNNMTRYEKKVDTINEEGQMVHIQEVKTPLEEATYLLRQIQMLQKQGVQNEEIAILFRTNLDARVVASTFVEYGVPFHMKEYLPNIYEHFISKNIMTYMRLSLGDVNRRYLLEIMNRPNRYISRDAVEGQDAGFETIRRFYCDKEWMQDRIDQFEWDLKLMKKMTPFAFIEYLRKRVGYNDYLREYAQFRKINVQELFEVLEEIQEQAKNKKTIQEWLDYVNDYTEKLKSQMDTRRANKNAISLHTMHASKGLEFEHVFIIGGNEGVTPSKKAVLPEEIEEERRMFYVAMTRAKKGLTITYVKEKNGKDMDPSRFVSELIFV